MVHSFCARAENLEKHKKTLDVFLVENLSCEASVMIWSEHGVNMGFARQLPLDSTLGWNTLFLRKLMCGGLIY